MKKFTMCAVFCLSAIGLSGCQPEQSCPACDCSAQCAEKTTDTQPEVKADQAAAMAEVKADQPKPEVKERPLDQRDLEGQKEVLEFMKKQKTYYLATVENDQPRVRPFGTVELFEGSLYIQTGRKKNVSQQIEANGKIELCTYDGERWLRLAATAIADDRVEAQTHMLDAYPDLKKMYQPGDGNTVVYKLVNVTATYYGFADEPRVIQF